ncbi:MAG: alpha/beta fold hydrolase [Sulfobacillus thermotolerans]|nr:alpha/beta fold hydrolase [Sulfobacillus thermotolerans]
MLIHWATELKYGNILKEVKLMDEFTVVAADGARIETYFATGGKVGVILCHGKAFDRDSFVEYGETLQQAGYTVAIPNFRGYGASSVGSEGPDAIELDVIAVASELRSRGHHVVALGASRGGGGVLRAAALRPELFAALITWSTVAVPDATAVRLGTMPKLFIVSESEMMHDQTLAVFRIAPEPKTLKEIPGGRHAQKIWQGPDRSLLEAEVSAFLATVSAQQE